MTNQEAIDIIKNAIAQVEWDYPMDYAAAFDMAIEALEKQEVPDTNAGKWISVKDRMPGNNKDVIIYGEWKGASGTKYRELFLSGMEDFIYQGYTPIAWMPLPEPPKEETK